MSAIPVRLRRRRLLLAGACVTAALLTGACAGGSDESSSAKPASTDSAGTSVVVDTFMFSPKRVHLKVGDTVTWTNHDNILHTVTSGTRDYEAGNSGHVTATHKDGLFDMQLDGKDATARHTFDKAGTYHYFCDRHPGMEADVDVA